MAQTAEESECAAVEFVLVCFVCLVFRLQEISFSFLMRGFSQIVANYTQRTQWKGEQIR